MWRGDFRCTTGRAILSVGIAHRAVQDGGIYVAFEFSYQQYYSSLFFILQFSESLRKQPSREMTSEKRAQKFHTDYASLPRSG